jgi:hypothetical protein
LTITNRVIHALIGIGLLLPVGAFANARWLNAAGALAGVMLLVWERIQRRAQAPPVTAMPAEEDAAVTTPTDHRTTLDRIGVRGGGDAE